MRSFCPLSTPVAAASRLPKYYHEHYGADTWTHFFRYCLEFTRQTARLLVRMDMEEHSILRVCGGKLGQVFCLVAETDRENRA